MIDFSVFHPLFKSVGVFTLLAILLSCGGGGDTVAMQDPGGGIDGTGFTAGSGGGTITGFGSVIFGGSEFTTTQETQITLDGLVVNENDLEIGMVASYEIGDDAAIDLSTGTAQIIAVTSTVKGVVTSVNPLEVLGQTVIVNSNTLLENIAGNDLAQLSIGDTVTVFGFQENDNSVRATRIEMNAAIYSNVLTEWKVSGRVTTVLATTLNIGTQTVNINSATLTNCGSGIVQGDFVLVRASSNPVTGFTTLNLVSTVVCGQMGIGVPANPQAQTIKGQFEGIVSDYTGQGDLEFFVGGQHVVIVISGAAQTVFEDGTIDDLANGVQVEAEGSFDITSGTLISNEIEFHQLRAEIVAPVDPVSINFANNSFEVMGITVVINGATSDEVGVLSGGLSSVRQLSIHGEINNGSILAQEIRDEGVPKFNEVKLQGTISNKIPNTSFEILGVKVLLDGNTQFVDEFDQIIIGGAEVFFATTLEGDLLEIGGEFSITSPPTITANEVQIED